MILSACFPLVIIKILGVTIHYYLKKSHIWQLPLKGIHSSKSLSIPRYFYYRLSYSFWSWRCRSIHRKLLFHHWYMMCKGIRLVLVTHLIWQNPMLGLQVLYPWILHMGLHLYCSWLTLVGSILWVCWFECNFVVRLFLRLPLPSLLNTFLDLLVGSKLDNNHKYRNFELFAGGLIRLGISNSLFCG